MSRVEDKLNWMPWFVADWQASTILMSVEERGVYFDLLCYQWQHGRLPLDVRDLARISRVDVRKMRRIFATLRAKFEQDSEGFFNQRLSEVRQNQEDTYYKRAKAGKKGGQAGLKHIDKERDIDKELPKGSTPVVPKGTNDFERFWEAYPKKVGKGAAQRAWKTHSNARPPTDTLIELVQANIAKNTDWVKDGGQYIPNPATWINQHRWEDEIIKPNGTAKMSKAELVKHSMS